MIISTNNHNFQPTTNIIQYVTVVADSHLQKGEKGKLRRANKTYNDTNITVRGENVLGELIAKMIMLVPFVIDPHERRGHLMQRFILETSLKEGQIVCKDRPDAEVTNQRLLTVPCPSGISFIAGIKWKKRQTEGGVLWGNIHSANTG